MADCEVTKRPEGLKRCLLFLYYPSQFTKISACLHFANRGPVYLLNQPTYQPTNLSTYQPTNQPINQLTNKPTNQPTNQPKDPTTHQLANQPTNPPTYQLTNQPTNQPTN